MSQQLSFISRWLRPESVRAHVAVIVDAPAAPWEEFHTRVTKPGDRIDKQEGHPLAVLSAGPGIGKSRLVSELPALALEQLKADTEYGELAKQFRRVEIRITFANGSPLSTTEKLCGGEYLVAVRSLYSLVQSSLNQKQTGTNDELSKGIKEYSEFFDACSESLPKLSFRHVVDAIAAACHDPTAVKQRPIFLSVVIDEAQFLALAPNNNIPEECVYVACHFAFLPVL